MPVTTKTIIEETFECDICMKVIDSNEAITAKNNTTDVTWCIFYFVVGSKVCTI